MKKYFLVAESKVNGFDVHVTDNPRGCEILKEFEAERFSDAVKMFNFSAKGMKATAYCGVRPDGSVFHGEA